MAIMVVNWTRRLSWIMLFCMVLRIRECIYCYRLVWNVNHKYYMAQRNGSGDWTATSHFTAHVIWLTVMVTEQLRHTSLHMLYDLLLWWLNSYVTLHCICHMTYCYGDWTATSHFIAHVIWLTVMVTQQLSHTSLLMLYDLPFWWLNSYVTPHCTCRMTYHYVDRMVIENFLRLAM